MNLHVSNEILVAIVTAVGGGLGYLLNKNASFIKELVDSINGIKTEFTALLENNKATRERVKDIEESRKLDKQAFIPIINENRQRLMVLEKTVEDHAEEIDSLRESRHSHGNFITGLEGRVKILELKAE